MMPDAAPHRSRLVSRLPKVFVVNQPLRRDPATDELKPTHNLRPAKAFGLLVHLTEPGSEIADGAAAVEQMLEELYDFSAADFLLPIGDPVLIGVAVAIAAWASGGPVTLLKWNRQGGRNGVKPGYHPYTVDLGRFVNPV